MVLFDVDPHSWEWRAGRIVNHNLTRDEWNLYLSDIPYRTTFIHQPTSPGDEPGPPSSATGTMDATTDKT